jgi:hypothetical protein
MFPQKQEILGRKYLRLFPRNKVAFTFDLSSSFFRNIGTLLLKFGRL